MPGLSVFKKTEDGKIYHTYSGYARGLEPMNAAWGLLDLLPHGRDEKGNMDWIKHADEY